MQMLVDKIWFLMSEMNRGPGYHIYHRTCLHLKSPADFDFVRLSTDKEIIVYNFNGRFI